MKVPGSHSFRIWILVLGSKEHPWLNKETLFRSASYQVDNIWPPFVPLSGSRDVLEKLTFSLVQKLKHSHRHCLYGDNYSLRKCLSSGQGFTVIRAKTGHVFPLTLEATQIQMVSSNEHVLHRSGNIRIGILSQSGVQSTLYVIFNRSSMMSGKGIGTCPAPCHYWSDIDFRAKNSKAKSWLCYQIEIEIFRSKYKSSIGT